MFINLSNHVSDKWSEKHVVQDTKDETYIVGEIWHNATEWINQDGLDGVTNYAVSRAILSFICDPDNRRSTNWEEDSEDVRDIFNMCSMFIRLRMEHPGLANEGTFR